MQTFNREYKIHAWFTYEEAEKKATQLMNEDLNISCYEILLEDKTVAQGVQAVSE